MYAYQLKSREGLVEFSGSAEQVREYLTQAADSA